MKYCINRRVLALALVLFSAVVAARDYDLVISNGRVMDPETNFDRVADVGIKDGKVAKISTKALSGQRVIDASGHVVAPGFIDYHSHGQEPYAFRLYARDCVTTPLDLELGAHGIDEFYDYWENETAIVNYGTSASHAFSRIAVLDGVDPGRSPIYNGALGAAMQDGALFKTKVYDPKDEPAILEAVEHGLKRGALGVSYPLGYYTVVGEPEVMAVAGLAAKYNQIVTVHVRYLSQVPPSGYLGLEELLTVARIHDVPLLMHHVPSNCLGLTKECLDLIEAAQSQGQKVVGEFYPYQYAGTYVDADYLRPGYETNLGVDVSDIVVTETGKPLTDEEFDRLRKEAPTTGLLMYTMKEEYIMEAFLRPTTIVGSDAMPYQFEDGYTGDWDKPYGAGNGHARGAGAHARILRMARENDNISLMDALAKMTYLPAAFIEDHVPQMKIRGRLQKGSAADITIFDPEAVTDNATAKIGENSLPSTGIPYVIVNGQVVVDDSVVQRVDAGVAIRNPIIE